MGGTSPKKRTCDYMPPSVPDSPVIEALNGRASRLHPLPDHVLELGSDLVLVHRYHVLDHGRHQLLLRICRKRHAAFHIAGVVAAIDVFPCHKAPPCLLYTSDAADDLLCVDLGGRRII